jgi:hypothetical protein
MPRSFAEWMILKTEKSILKTIAYFDMFRYPVTAEEICLFLDQPATASEIETELALLTAKEQVFKLDEFYSLQNDVSLIARRRDGNIRANKLLHIAYRIGRLLYKFPFVKGVGISGSLSKNYADTDADIDFFIVTQHNRLWIARTLLHCLKKLSFLIGRQHWFCMNYFIDEEALVIAEKNLFTATEVVTLKPVCGDWITPLFFMANDWVIDFLPNHTTPKENIESNDAGDKQSIEELPDNSYLNRLDNYLMRVTAKRWHKKEVQQKLNCKGDRIGLSINKHFARPNPEHLQKKLLSMYAGRLQAMEEKWGLSFVGTGHFFRKEII